MANAHSFPLLRLPNLAREHVVKVMEVQEQYIFATLSKKSKILTKIGIRKLSYNLDLILASEHIFVRLQKAGTNNRFVLMIHTVHVEEVDSHYDARYEVEDIMQTLMEQLPFLIEIFEISNCKIKTRCIPNECAKQFLTTVRDFNIGIDKLKVEVEEPDNEMFQWVMENCRDVKRLKNYCETTDDFQWDSREPFTSEYVSLWNAPWLTMDHLTRLFMNCRFFEIHCSGHELDADDLNQLVKMWMNDSRLEFVKIDVFVRLDLPQIMHDIEKEPIHQAYIENIRGRFGDGMMYKIRQKCGKEAVVYNSGLKFIITTHFDNPRCDFWKRRYNPRMIRGRGRGRY